jgi:hypothetical protein
VVPSQFNLQWQTVGHQCPSTAVTSRCLRWQSPPARSGNARGSHSRMAAKKHRAAGVAPVERPTTHHVASPRAEDPRSPRRPRSDTTDRGEHPPQPLPTARLDGRPMVQVTSRAGAHTGALVPTGCLHHRDSRSRSVELLSSAHLRRRGARPTGSEAIVAQATTASPPRSPSRSIHVEGVLRVLDGGCHLGRAECRLHHLVALKGEFDNSVARRRLGRRRNDVILTQRVSPGSLRTVEV